MNNNMYDNMNNTNGMNTQPQNFSGNNPQVTNTNTTLNAYGQSYQQPQPDPMAALANLSKEDAMEAALSHTNKYTPFEAQKQEILEEPKKENSKSVWLFLGIIFAVLLLFIIFLPQISNLFGW